MSSTPTVSVVIATYNQAEYLSQAIKSVLRQTYEHWELIIVNDGSTDHTEQVVKPYLRHQKVRYYKKPNGGQASAKNMGIREARGEYVAFLDSDDYWEPSKLLAQMAIMQAQPSIGVVYSEIHSMDESGRQLIFERPSRYSGEVVGQLYGDNCVPFSSSMVRRSLLNRYGGFDESLRMGIDYDLWLRLSVVTLFEFIEEPLVWVRKTPTQMSASAEGRVYWATEVERRFRERYPQFVTNQMIRQCEMGWAYLGFRIYEATDSVKAVHAILRMFRINPLSLIPYKSLGRFLLVDVLAVIER